MKKIKSKVKAKKELNFTLITLLAILLLISAVYPVYTLWKYGAKSEIHKMTDDNSSIVLVELTPENNFTYAVENGYFTRDALSGPGTGMFMGKNFKFKQGNCNSSNNYIYDEKLGCVAKEIGIVWCARNKIDPSIQYEIIFKSWMEALTICHGECKPGVSLSFILTKK
jgi:hypothetical protein